MKLTASQISESFAKFEKKKVAALLRKSEGAPIKEQANLQYLEPSICPYCKNQMVLSKIRMSNGELQPVYLCREDRTVGVVPNETIKKLALDNPPLITPKSEPGNSAPRALLFDY